MQFTYLGIDIIKKCRKRSVLKAAVITNYTLIAYEKAIDYAIFQHLDQKQKKQIVIIDKVLSNIQKALHAFCLSVETIHNIS